MPSTFKNKSVVVFLSLMLIGAFIYGFVKTKQVAKYERGYMQEKEDLESSLDHSVKTYQDAIAEKTELSGRLELELNKIIQLRDSIKQLKTFNYEILKKYKERILELTKDKKYLLAKVDSLKDAYSNLKQENIIANELLTQKESLNKNLVKVNTQLKETSEKLQGKVNKAGIIKISPITLTAMKERRNGKLTTTSRSSRTDAFKINFSLLKNEFSKPGKRKVYIQIKNTDNKTVASKGIVKVADNKALTYSDFVVANYQNQNLSVVSLINVDRDSINKGGYTSNIFIDSLYVGSQSIFLR